MERVVALMCNPSAGGGRAARVLPEVEDSLREHPTTIRVIPRAMRVLAPQ